MQKEQTTSRAQILSFATIFLAAFLVLFVNMSRRPGFYDESIMLTGAMRVAAGQVPHRDFYFIYGPAEIYILAGLFKVFGPWLLLERLFDLTLKSLLIGTAYFITRRYCNRWIAGLTSFLVFLWIIGLSLYGFATTPVSLLNLIGSFLILPVFAGRVSNRRLLVAGAVSGLTALCRYDTGVALAGLHCCLFAVAVLLRCNGLRERLRQFGSAVLPYLTGFFLVVLPPAIYFWSVAPISSFLHDIILFPARYYRSGRHLPFPGIDPRTVENIAVYLPIAIAVLVVCYLLKKSGREQHTVERQGALITFSALMAVMYLKGLVRVSPIQMYLATIPSLLIMAILLEQRAERGRVMRAAILCIMGLCVVSPSWTAMHEIRRHELWHDSVFQEFVRPRPTSTEVEWCKQRNPLTGAVCFLPEDDRVHSIEFIRNHTKPGDTLYSGVDHHDLVFANDNLVYFASQRMPATRWSHFDPNLQNRYEIQQQMVNDLKTGRPPYVVLDSEFDLLHEPNDSSKSSGVTLLDTYLQGAYQPLQNFGTMAIWKRR